jgi:hypothetical protein
MKGDIALHGALKNYLKGHSHKNYKHSVIDDQSDWRDSFTKCLTSGVLYKSIYLTSSDYYFCHFPFL